jgi:hypothetical protein
MNKNNENNNNQPIKIIEQPINVTLSFSGAVITIEREKRIIPTSRTDWSVNYGRRKH